ncbi:MAG TPA: arylsulfotransferase family protein [Polyangiaceae bacterium]|nr:arylsulfotransferase family protein [Polyangiaceae bacterium]
MAAAPAPLAPPPITVLTSKAGTEPGLVFVAPKTTPSASIQQGPEIIDEQGRPVWFQAVGANQQAANFRVQEYRGEPVLTWWQGSNSPTGPGEGQGVDYVYDRSYRQIAVVAAGNGYQADIHEFRITPRGTAFITIYNHIPYDLSSVGGPANGSVVDGVAQEVNVATGVVVWEWHSIDHVPLSESQAPVPTSATASYDYFHINAVNWDVDGNVLVDARNTWTAYKIDYRTKDIIWRQGGKSSNFALTTGDGGTQTAWQHDPEAVDRDTLRIFDNEASPSVLPYSRVVWIRRDPFDHGSTLVKELIHPDKIQAGSQGNAQALGQGHTFVGWGATGRFSEFDAAGNLLFDANVPSTGGWDTYRAYRFVWHATPDTRPTATASRNADGSVTVHAIWNGATDVAHWIVLAGKDQRSLWPIASTAWKGLDTSLGVSTKDARVAVVALARDGRLLGRSADVAITTP